MHDRNTRAYARCVRITLPTEVNSMTHHTSTERLQLAHTLCQALAQAGTPVQLRGIREEAYEIHYVLSPGSGRTVDHILQQTALIKQTVDRRGTRVKRDEGDVVVSVTHDFELFLILNYLVPLFVPSLLVLNVAAIERTLRILFNAAPDGTAALIFVLAVLLLDACLANILPGIIRRSRGTADREKAEH